MNRNFEGVWITKDVWLTKELSLAEKVTFVEIRSLETEDRGCYASNQHFAELLNVTPSRASQVISSLVAKGFVDVELIYSGKAVRERRIRLKGYLENEGRGTKFPKEGYLGNAQEKSTNSNSTENNSPPSDTDHAVTTKTKSVTSKAKRKITIAEWMESMGEQELIPDNHACRKTARTVGLADEFVDLALDEMIDRNTGGSTKYADWGLALNNAIRGNWYKLWYRSNDDGHWYLTTAGKTRQALSQAAVDA